MDLHFPEIKKIGFYPIVNSASWVEKLLAVGVKTIQIRIKDLTGKDLEKEIEKAVEISYQYPNSQLFINDRWELAIKYRAFGVHLGQEDIDNLSLENFKSISDANLRLGISTHNETEVKKALKLNPSYISIGPIFHTKSKDLPYEPQGIEGFKLWRKKLNLPLVALAGITFENGKELVEAGADGIAVMSNLMNANDPENLAKMWMKLFKDKE